MSPLRIALVSEHASPLAVLGGVDAGGQNVHVAALANQLGRLGHDVVVYTRRDDAGLPTSVAFAPNVTVHHIDAGPPVRVRMDDLFPFMQDFARALGREWGSFRPDVIHAHFWMSGYAALRAEARRSAPVVQTFHALGVVKRRHQGAKDPSPPERIDVERDIVERADQIIATCSDEVFELLRMGADPRRLRAVPCGVDTEVFRPDGPSERRDGAPHRILSVGRLVERKGVGNVIAALAEIPDVELVIAGGSTRAALDADPNANRLRKVAEAAGVGDRVSFRGRVQQRDLPALYRSADVCVCVPWYEPFGIVPLESMACGVPVVASAVGGLTDTVVDGVTGVHVPPRDPHGLAEALRPLLAEDDRRRRLGRAGVQRARRRYTWERVASATDEAYRSLVPSTIASIGVVR